MRQNNARKKILVIAIEGLERAGFYDLFGSFSRGVLGGAGHASSQSENLPRLHCVESDEIFNKF